MRIACFSFNAPPRNDPEAFCTARFAGALAAQGADVTLLTVPHREEVDDSVCDELLGRDIQVVRLALDPKARVGLGDLLRYRCLSPHAAHISSLVDGVRRHLARRPDSVLVTRGFPAVSNVVGYHARASATRWVAHMSDPFPGIGQYSGRTRHVEWLDTRWARRILASADLVSVTSRNAVRWFRATHPACARTPFHVAYHVGAPPLAHDGIDVALDPHRANFVHVGLWGRRRFMADVFREISAAHAADPRILFHQFGPVDPGVAEEVRRGAFPWLRLDARPVAPRLASALLASASVNVVIDQNDHLPFGPYLASKFAYAVASGRPLLAVGQPDSEMGRLCAEHGSFHFADIARQNALRDMLLGIAGQRFASLAVPSAPLRRLFEPADVARGFLAAVASSSPRPDRTGHSWMRVSRAS